MKKLHRLFFILASLSICFACVKQEDKSQLLEPKIKAGVARLSIIVPDGVKEEMTTSELKVPLPITGGVEVAKGYYEDADSVKFVFEIPVETDWSIGLLNNIQVVTLKAGEEFEMSFSFDSVSNAYIPRFKDDFFELEEQAMYDNLILEMVYFFDIPSLPTAREEMSYDDLIRFDIDSNLNVRFKVLDNDTIISERMKAYMKLDFTDFFINAQMFEYVRMARLAYMNSYSEDERAQYVDAPAPGRDYYKFLKEFDLNNPRHAYSASYSEVLLNILANDTINLMPIGDMPIAAWLKDVKAKLSDLVGFDRGFFYEALIGNAYSKQFDDEMKPLTDAQKKNLNTYFKGGEIEKILLRKNEKIIKLDAKRYATVVNDIPDVPKEQLMDAIIAKYKGKVVFVDLWATWCGPCLNGINEFKEVKGDFKDKDVVFVYITNASSPNGLWSEKIKGIGGEHYYLQNDDQWYCILKDFDSGSIPTYAIYNKEGKLSEIMIGGRDAQELVDKINVLLKE